MKKRRFYTRLGLSLFIILATYIASLLLSAPIHLAYMVNSKYLPYAMVSLTSAVQNKKPSTRYKVHIIAEDFTASDIKTIKKMEQFGLDICIHPVQRKQLDTSHLGRFASFEIALQKLFIAEYLKDVDKVLYLDADTIVQTDLSDVFKTNLNNVYVAATKDGLMYQFPEHIEEIQLQRSFYFNSGIMLLNLKLIRKDNIIRQALTYFNTHQEVFGDQDILNVVFKEKAIPLSYRYNCTSTFFETDDASFLSHFYNEPVPANPIDVYKNAYILHFAGHKPWTQWFQVPYLKELWYMYADEAKAKYQISY